MEPGTWMVEPLSDTGRREDFAALYAVAQVLINHSGQREILSQVLDVMESMLDMRRGTVMLLSLDGSELLVEAVKEAGTPPQGEVRYRKGEGIMGRVLQTGQPAIIPRISEEPQFCDRIHRRGTAAGEELSFICVPVVLGSEVVGALSADIPYAVGRGRGRQAFLGFRPSRTFGSVMKAPGQPPWASMVLSIPAIRRIVSARATTIFR